MKKYMGKAVIMMGTEAPNDVMALKILERSLRQFSKIVRIDVEEIIK